MPTIAQLARQLREAQHAAQVVGGRATEQQVQQTRQALHDHPSTQAARNTEARHHGGR